MSSSPSPASPWGGGGQPPAPSVAKRILSGVLCLIGVAILVSLGVWQLQRLAWKEDLLARVAALQTAQPRPLEGLLTSGADVDFTRASAACPDLERRPMLRMFSVRDGTAGYHLIAACPIKAGPYATILVDRGFISIEQSAAAMQPGRETLPGPVTGVLRKGDKATFVTPANRIGENLWYSRDVAAMAKALNAPAPAPVFLMLEKPAALPSGPLPAPVPTDIPNRHLEYALTWFGLAAALVGVYVAMLLRRRQT
jgi:surfeit locus 1 family protein